MYYFKAKLVIWRKLLYFIQRISCFLAGAIPTAVFQVAYKKWLHIKE